ncbi:MAG: DUF1700 domain-containing protein [Lachnospiraceae bacterium]|nr:DUF1700 domain-containing protein [Lachnospiraceae bacterium]
MTKTEFLSALRLGLAGLPEKDIEERVSFYAEMIDDRTEEGLTEEEAVDAVGPVGTVISQIAEETPLSKLVKEKIKPKRRLKGIEIALMILGAPLWVSLLIAAFAVLLALIVAFWAVIVAFWAVFASLAACGLAGITAGIGFAVGGKGLSGLALIGAGLFLLGLSVFAFFGCKAATKGIFVLTKKALSGVKKAFLKKEATR